MMVSYPLLMVRNPTLPVENISWAQATEFAALLSKQELARGSLPVGWEIRLPTEAQWEWACRAGSATAYWWGADADTTGKVANVERHGTLIGAGVRHGNCG